MGEKYLLEDKCNFEFLRVNKKIIFFFVSSMSW
jgi:hypothetical protein